MNPNTNYNNYEFTVKDRFLKYIKSMPLILIILQFFNILLTLYIQIK